MLMDYHDFLSCIYVAASEVKHQPSLDEILEDIMEAYTGATPDISMAHKDLNKKGMNLLAAVGVQVIHRCQNPKKSQIFNVSSCSLIHVQFSAS